MLLATAQGYGTSGMQHGKNKITSKKTYPDNDCFIPLELGDISVASGNLGAVEGPETAHHFDGALRRVGHLPRFTNGNSPTKQKIIKRILDPRNGYAGSKWEAEPLFSYCKFRKDFESCVPPNNLCFPPSHFPLLLRGHDTGGSAAGHLTPPAAVDVVHNDVTPTALPVLL